MTVGSLASPFPWFGGKRRAAAEVWQALGDVDHYIEPFAGSLAVLLNRPTAPKVETVNDLDGYICNFWRAIQRDPDAVADWCLSPVNEIDLTARHRWLCERERKTAFLARMHEDPDYHDAKIAGWWVWGISAWIGSNWCTGWWDGGTGGTDVHRKLPHLGDGGTGVHRKLPHLGTGGKGVHRQLPHLGDGGKGGTASCPTSGTAGFGGKLPRIGTNGGGGIHRKEPHIGEAGTDPSDLTNVRPYLRALSARLRYVRVCCGDWSRVCTEAVWTDLAKGNKRAGVFLDPPYTVGTKADDLYAAGGAGVAEAVAAWAFANGDNPRQRIVLCGYEGEHVIPPTWRTIERKEKGGYANTGKGENANRHRERLWLSPSCLVTERERQGVML
jgi:site-specific DNA-adenine methylase